MDDDEPSKTGTQPLVTIIDTSSDDKDSMSRLAFARLVILLGSFCIGSAIKDFELRVRHALGKIQNTDDFAQDVIDLANLLTEALKETAALETDGDHAALQIGCINALNVVAQQITEDYGALPLFFNTVGSRAIQNAAVILCDRRDSEPWCDRLKRSAYAKSCAAAWLQLFFVLLVRAKTLPLQCNIADVFGVALEGARYRSSSNDFADVNLRRNGLKLLAGLIGIVPNSFDNLPLASSAQAISAVQSIAAMDPDRDLRKLAADIVDALQNSKERAT